MRILTVSCLYPPIEPNGGASIYAHLLTKEYKNNKNEVAVFAGGINPKKNLYEVQEEEYEGINILRINLDYESFDQPIRRLLGSKEITEKYQQFLKKFKPDIVHFHSIQGLGIGLITETKKLGIKTAITVHDSWWLCPRQFFLKNDKTTFCQQKSLSNCSLCYAFLEEKNKIFKNLKKEYEILLRNKPLINIFCSIDIKIFPSKFIFNTYSKYIKNQNNWFVSQNGIEIPTIKIPKTNLDYINFIFVGGGSKEKGAELLINTWQKNFSKNKNIKLNIYGSNTEDIINIINSDNICIKEKYKNSDISEIMSQNDVLIFPSIIPENSPITIKEALAHSLPVIASDVGGVPELIIDNTNGLIFKNNSEKELSKKINILSDKKIIKLFSINTKNNVQYIKKQTNELLKTFKKSKQLDNTFKKVFSPIYTLNKILFFSKDNPKNNLINFCKQEKINKTIENSILFNLDKNRSFFFKKNKRLIENNTKHLIEIYRQENKTNIQTSIPEKYIINKRGISTWIELWKIIKTNKIKTIILPFENLRPLKIVNKILFLLMGIRNLITIKDCKFFKNYPKITIHFKETDFIHKLFSIIIKLVKFFLFILMIPIYLTFVLTALFFSEYGHSRIIKIYKKISSKISKIIPKIISIPLELIKQSLLLIVRIGISL